MIYFNPDQSQHTLFTSLSSQNNGDRVVKTCLDDCALSSILHVPFIPEGKLLKKEQA